MPPTPEERAQSIRFYVVTSWGKESWERPWEDVRADITAAIRDAEHEARLAGARAGVENMWYEEYFIPAKADELAADVVARLEMKNKT